MIKFNQESWMVQKPNWVYGPSTPLFVNTETLARTTALRLGDGVDIMPITHSIEIYENYEEIEESLSIVKSRALLKLTEMEKMALGLI